MYSSSLGLYMLAFCRRRSIYGRTSRTGLFIPNYGGRGGLVTRSTSGFAVNPFQCAALREQPYAAAAPCGVRFHCAAAFPLTCHGCCIPTCRICCAYAVRVTAWPALGAVPSLNLCCFVYLAWRFRSRRIPRNGLPVAGRTWTPLVALVVCWRYLRRTTRCGFFAFAWLGYRVVGIVCSLRTVVRRFACT